MKEGIVMAKLELREACYVGIENVQKCRGQYGEEHEKLVKEANRQIEESRIRYASAYKNAGSYLGK